MRDLEPAPLSWIESAPHVIRVSAKLAAPPERVFAAFADGPGWTSWFPMMTQAAWVDGKTSGVGAERDVAMRLFGRFRERFIAWEPGRRFSFTIVQSTSPLLRRFAEDYRLSADGAGTRFDWTAGAEPANAAASLLAPGLRLFMRRLLARAAKNLDASLR